MNPQEIAKILLRYLDKDRDTFTWDFQANTAVHSTLYEILQKAKGYYSTLGINPDKFLWSFLHDVLDEISENGTTSPMQASDNVGVSRTMNRELVEWLSTNYARAEIVNSFVNQNNRNDKFDLWAAILEGYLIEWRDIYQIVSDHLQGLGDRAFSVEGAVD